MAVNVTGGRSLKALFGVVADVAGPLMATALIGWVMLFLGQRVIVSMAGLAKLLSWFGVLLIAAPALLRLRAAFTAPAELKNATRAFAGLGAMQLLALALYGATTDKGRELLHVAKPTLSGEDKFGSIVTVAWIALFVMGVLANLLGDIAAWSMRNAEKIESRRILAAIAGGLVMGAAAVYGSLFTYAADQWDKSWDFSYFRTSRASESTKRMIDSLSEPLEVLVFIPPTTEVRGEVMKYLQDLRTGREDKLTVSPHDFLGEPELAKEHKLVKDGQLVLVRGKASQKLDIGVEENQAKRLLKKLDGEFQKVLLKAMRDRRTAYLTVGHGELNEDSDKRNARSAEGVRQLLEGQNYQVKTLGLADGLGSEIPSDATVVVVLGPQNRFTDAEVSTLRQYTEKGGKLFLALDPDGKADLAPLAAVAGIDWKPTLVVNEQAQARLQGTPADKKILVAVTFSSHAAVSTLSKYGHSAPVLFSGAAALERAKDADGALLVDFSIKSMFGTFIDENGDLNFDPADRKGTFNLAAAVSHKLGDGKDAQEMRAFVVGDADCVSDFWFMQDRNNQLMFVEALRWLGGEESFSGEIQSEEDVAIVHTKAEDQAYFYGTILGAPSLVLGLGLLITMRRKKKSEDDPEPEPEKQPRKSGEVKKSEPDDAEADSSDEPEGDGDGDEADDEDEQEDEPEKRAGGES
jgi:hypothetical protein